MLRIGLGHDTHRLTAGGPLILGGVSIEHERHAVGHSDADVLLHAVTDALLGAAGMGDIGQWFSDTDPANKDRDSKEMLAIVRAKIDDLGYRVVNLDAVVFTQRPKISPHRSAIQDSLAGLLSVSADRVNVKAKTGERVGPVGREEAIMAEAIVLLERPGKDVN